VNVWLVSAVVLLVGLVPCALVSVRSDIPSALAAMQMATILLVEVLVLLAVGFGRSIYADVAVVLGVLSFPSTLVFVRFLERWR
jgi:multisubunit Na+/H+ antiporter MnhF subunit